jgi:uncharacterized membrane protein
MSSLSLSRPRRVFVSRENGQLVIKIRRQGNHAHHIWGLAFSTIGFGIFCRVLIPAFFRLRAAHDLVYLFPVVLFVGVWYLVMLRVFLWPAFGVEEVAIGRDAIKCVRRIFRWERTFEARPDDITSVTVKIPWHEGSGSVRFTANGQTYAIGDGILPVEANEIAEELRRAISLPRQLQSVPKSRS